jgi:hypothetical protein
MGVRFVGVRTVAAAESSLEDAPLLNGVCAVFAAGSFDAGWRSAAGFCGVFMPGSGSSRTEGRSSRDDCSCSDCAVSQLSFDPALAALSGVGAGCSGEVSARKQVGHGDRSKACVRIPSAASLIDAPCCRVGATRYESCQCRASGSRKGYMSESTGGYDKKVNSVCTALCAFRPTQNVASLDGSRKQPHHGINGFGHVVIVNTAAQQAVRY